MQSLHDAKARITNKIAELAKELGREAAQFTDVDLISQTGLLDSAALMWLIVWYEEEFGISTEDEELTIDNFGTVQLMVDYLNRHA